ncbi:glycosyltransferase family 4 protein [uncultured Duncaniella sp.]|uniref:glycosyltransferase family 4 protein n=1 Tax=uncultured Duncaniella sp. TaxID=2768039 RepID=UPI002674E8CF|nr:glycosyltransferase family 4 protein [uncultured Duncaniella sp.]
MKIVFCHCSIYNPGGMERVLQNKVKWLASHGHEVMVVTTDQDRRPPFYEFPEGVRLLDLGINYSADNGKPLYRKVVAFLRKRRLHRRRLSDLLKMERPDITVSLYPSESSFIPDINDGSKKVLELHFNRFFRLQYGRNGIIGWIDRFRSQRDVAIARRFDSFVVLTDEDRSYWGDMDNISVIPNAAMPLADVCSDCSAKRVIAVGRLDYQKRFDRLIRIWNLVMQDSSLGDWHLDIFGQGEWNEHLNDMINKYGLTESVTIHAPVKNIGYEYASSSILVMTSAYEGFPMVMVEAMSLGLPVVSYDFKCGPRDIIKNGENGILVNGSDEQKFAKELALLMSDEHNRMKMGMNARDVKNWLSEDVIMDIWMKLFHNLKERRI